MSENQINIRNFEQPDSVQARPGVLLARESIDRAMRESCATPPELLLKGKSTLQLKDMLLAGATEWSREDQVKLDVAINLAEILHANHIYKGDAYIKHPLRVANRLRHYLGIDDPPVIYAGILHDGVEDGAEKLVEMHIQRPEQQGRDYDLSSLGMQRIALLELERVFCKRTSGIIAAVTNPPSEEKPASYDDKLAAYANKVAEAVKTKEGFAVKVCDWCDHGPGIIYGENKDIGSSSHFSRKYGLALPIYEGRFYQPDMQDYLGQKGVKYLSHQFKLGRERLLTADQ